MTDEVETVEEADVGKIEIFVSEGEFSYNTNMTVPDLLFWLRVVGDFATQQVLAPEEE